MRLKLNGIFLLIPLLLFMVTGHAYGGTGTRYLFKSEVMHAQALRTMGHSVYAGAAPGEVLAAIGAIKDGDEESWYQAWHAMGKRCENLARSAGDDMSRGNALLRASNYYRAGEFFIDPAENGRRLAVYRESVRTFEEALNHLKIRHEIYAIPYENAQMRAYFFPGNKNKPLILVNGGYDSTVEEVFFFIGSALAARGYPVLIFEGPGQSNMIRKYHVRFTPDWHKPVSRALDYVLEKNRSLEHRKKILFGSSLGGLLAGRAVAYEKRIDGLVLFGSPFDMQEAAFSTMPGIARWIFHSENKQIFNLLVNLKSDFDITTRWGVKNGMWTIGGDTPYDFVQKIGALTLKDLAPRITCDTLLLYGERDRFIPDMRTTLKKYEQAFPHARSVTSVLFTEADGAAEHCQLGSMEQATLNFIRWMKAAKLE